MRVHSIRKLWTQKMPVEVLQWQIHGTFISYELVDLFWPLEIALKDNSKYLDWCKKCNCIFLKTNHESLSISKCCCNNNEHFSYQFDNFQSLVSWDETHFSSHSPSLPSSNWTFFHNSVVVLYQKFTSVIYLYLDLRYGKAKEPCKMQIGNYLFWFHH